MTADPEQLRSAMRQWATGIAIVTVTHNGISHGMTVSSFTSVSLTPPQVLISLAQNTRAHALARESKLFGVTLLAQGQQEISDRFAGRTPDDQDRLTGLETFTLETGVPLLKGGLAHFDCRVIATFTSGTHTIFIGAVLAAQGQPNADPLLYYNRDYRRIAW